MNKKATTTTFAVTPPPVIFSPKDSVSAICGGFDARTMHAWLKLNGWGWSINPYFSDMTSSNWIHARVAVPIGINRFRFFGGEAFDDPDLALAIAILTAAKMTGRGGAHGE